MKVAVPATRSNFKCLRFTNIHSVITIKLYGVHALLILCVFWVKKKKKKDFYTHQTNEANSLLKRWMCCTPEMLFHTKWLNYLCEAGHLLCCSFDTLCMCGYLSSSYWYMCSQYSWTRTVLIKISLINYLFIYSLHAKQRTTSFPQNNEAQQLVKGM